MSTIILVHGAWHGAWCWNDAFCDALKNGGENTVEPINLPGHGNKKAYEENTDLFDYTYIVMKSVAAAPDKVVLIGHSLAGITITKVAEKAARYMPGKIEKLIYLAAYVPIVHSGFWCSVIYNFKNIFDATKFTKSKKKDIFFIKNNKDIKPFLYGDCSDEDIKHAVELLCDEPYSLMYEKVKVTPKYYGNINKFYIHTEDDRILPFAMQKKMINDIEKKCEYTFKTAQIKSSHSPFMCKQKNNEGLAKYEELAKIILDFK